MHIYTLICYCMRMWLHVTTFRKCWNHEKLLAYRISIYTCLMSTWSYMILIDPRCWHLIFEAWYLAMHVHCIQVAGPAGFGSAALPACTTAAVPWWQAGASCVVQRIRSLGLMMLEWGCAGDLLSFCWKRGMTQSYWFPILMLDCAGIQRIKLSSKNKYEHKRFVSEWVGSRFPNSNHRIGVNRLLLVELNQHYEAVMTQRTGTWEKGPKMSLGEHRGCYSKFGVYIPKEIEAFPRKEKTNRHFEVAFCNRWIGYYFFPDRKSVV